MGPGSWLDAEMRVGGLEPQGLRKPWLHPHHLGTVPTHVSSRGCCSILPGLPASVFPPLSDPLTVITLAHKAPGGVLCIVILSECPCWEQVASNE